MSNKIDIRADRLKQLRLEAGYKTKAAFVEEYDRRFMECDPDGKSIESSYRQYENQKRTKPLNPEIQTIANICELLHCDLDYLCGRSDVAKKSYEIIAQETGLSNTSIIRLANEKRDLESPNSSIAIRALLSALIGYACASSELDSLEAALSNLIFLQGNYDEQKEKKLSEDEGMFYPLRLKLQKDYCADIYPDRIVFDVERQKAISAAQRLIENFIDQFLFEKGKTAFGAGSTESGQGQNEAPAL